MRSNGVKKCRRLALGSEFGPSCGNLYFGSTAACVVPQMFVTPSVRSVKPYAPATLIGTLTLFTETRAELFTTWATGKSCSEAFFMYFVFVQLYRALRPFFSGK